MQICMYRLVCTGSYIHICMCRLVGTDLCTRLCVQICVQACAYRFVCTDSCVQVRRYKIVCTGSWVQICIYRLMCTCSYVATQTPLQKSKFEGLPKKADFTIQLMSKLACFGQLVWGSSLQASVHICTRLCISTAFNAQRNTENLFPWTAPRKLIQRLVGADLYVQARVYRFVHTDFYVQTRVYRLGRSGTSAIGKKTI